MLVRYSVLLARYAGNPGVQVYVLLEKIKMLPYLLLGVVGSAGRLAYRALKMGAAFKVKVDVQPLFCRFEFSFCDQLLVPET